MRATLALCFVIFANAFGQELRPQAFRKSSDNRGDRDLSHENLLRQIQQWQQSLLEPGVQQPVEQFQVQPNNNNQVSNRYNNPNSNYNGNPWIQPTPAPEPPPPSYHEPSPPVGNPWYQPQTQPTIPPPNTGYFPPPTNNGGYYPPAPVQPVPTLPPTPTSPPVAPEVEALRKYCLQPRGQFPSNKCNTYINCWDDVIVEQECPTGLVFSEKGFCDYPYNVDCRGRPVPGVTPPPTVAHGKCPKPSGTYRNSHNCSEFFVCVNGSPIKFSCPDTLYYSTVLGVCDYAYNVDCINPRPLEPSYPQILPFPTEPPPPPTNPGGLPPPQPIYNPYYLQRVPAGLLDDTRSCIPNSVYRLVPDCSSVALCRSGKTEVITCGQYTAYDAQKGECVARHLARC